MKHKGPDIIHCFREDGSTRCTSYHDDACWDTPENRHLTFEFISQAQKALREAATLLQKRHTKTELEAWLELPVVRTVQRR